MSTLTVVIPTRELIERLKPYEHFFDYCGGVRELVASHVKCSAQWESDTHRQEVSDEIFFKYYLDFVNEKKERWISERETSRWWNQVIKLNEEISKEVQALTHPIFGSVQYDASYQAHAWRADDLIVHVDYWYA